MQKSPSSSSSSTSSNKMITLCGIMVYLILLNIAIILHDFYSTFHFIVSILKSFLGIISCTLVSSSATTSEKICINFERTPSAAADDRNPLFSELKKVIEKEGMADIGGLFEEEEPSLMEVKEAFDVFDENKDGFIDADELRNALFSLGFIKEAQGDDCERMIQGFDDNLDGRIDFNEFVKVLERSFCS
ncbi:putative calcium-binding protein CML30 [Hibiscus syriacus]|uniref:Calcium-binding protein CML30 n=1 Tax=Hibiscus syriacus TaxID=106335 RepID=A0A6A3CN21_HIBSY|nr:probable calcium-binding protein CML45 [Hibiscus syriacus]KAE8730865.1 putative calcium-binding protein CML30 [Hibiscus syriacus]